MAFGIPLSIEEKRYIVQFPELSHGAIARSLNRFFHDHNKGTRSRMVVYLFRHSKTFREIQRKL
jgi:hypothetical protein